VPAAGKEGVIGMHGGLPPDDVFPLTAAEFTFQAPDAGATAAPRTAAAGDGDSGESSATADMGGTAVATAIDDPAELAVLQQYALDPSGFAPLRTWLSELTERMQRPARHDWGTVIANGAIHSAELVMRSLLDPGEPILVEEFTFSQVLDGLVIPIGYRPVGVAMDNEGARQCAPQCPHCTAEACSCCLAHACCLLLAVAAIDACPAEICTATLAFCSVHAHCSRGWIDNAVLKASFLRRLSAQSTLPRRWARARACSTRSRTARTRPARRCRRRASAPCTPSARAATSRSSKTTRTRGSSSRRTAGPALVRPWMKRHQAGSTQMQNSDASRGSV
jgi:hypothetical protein